MEYIYSALLLHTAGKEINEENVKKVLDAAGITADTARIKALTASLEGVNIEEAISKSVVAPVAAAPAAGGAAAQAPAGDEKPAEEKKEEKKEKKKEEKVSEEEAAAGLGALFG
jgi:large subunit ribosomal protein L12